MVDALPRITLGKADVAAVRELVAHAGVRG
jgi:hypothetical protein